MPDDTSVTAFYDSISARYDSLRLSHSYPVFIDGLEKAFILERCSAGTVLEVGAGTGRITAALAQRCRALTAIDVSGGMLEVLRRHLRTPNVVVKRMALFDLEALDAFGGFDTVVCMRTLPHVADVGSALALIRRAVAPGGNVIFDLWNSRSLYFALRTALGRGKVFTRFLSPPTMARAMAQARLEVRDSMGWGFLMPVRPLLHRLEGGRLARHLYRLEGLGRTRLQAFAHALVFNCVPR